MVGDIEPKTNRNMESSFPECDCLPNQLRAICRNELGLPLDGPHGVNAYRASFGLPPIESANDKYAETAQEINANPKEIGGGGNGSASARPRSDERNEPAAKQLKLAQRATSLLSTVLSTAARTVTLGKVYASEDVIQARLEICQTCEQFTGDSCKLCGCACGAKAKLSNKLAHASSVCPNQPPRWCAVE